jgi:hypothetical protein
MNNQLKEKLNLAPWRPSSQNASYLNQFPEYVPPNPQPSKDDIQQMIRFKVQRLKLLQAHAGNDIFRPVGKSCHTYPVQSIICMNVERTPPSKLFGK